MNEAIPHAVPEVQHVPDEVPDRTDRSQGKRRHDRVEHLSSFSISRNAENLDEGPGTKDRERPY
jgi:hypothetical protein